MLQSCRLVVFPKIRMSMSLLNHLKNSYKDRTLLVVSCGPSARAWKQVRSLLPKNTVIACVKQAIFLCKSEASLHFFNAYNCQRYHPYNQNALRVYVGDSYLPICFNKRDISFSLNERTMGDITKSIAHTAMFEEHTIDKTGLVRCWGPGIMYEAVVYMAIFLGFRRIHTVGWDIAAEPRISNKEVRRVHHFYDLQVAPLSSVEREWSGRNLTLYKIKALARHVRGHPYNIVPKTDARGEVSTILRSLPRFFDWLQSEQVALTMHTYLQDKPINKKIRQHVADLGPELDDVLR
jgi:hypothetical protein